MACTKPELLACDSKAGDPTPATVSSGGRRRGAIAWQPPKPLPPEAMAVPLSQKGAGGGAAGEWRTDHRMRDVVQLGLQALLLPSPT